jgi:hypothetical protein
MEAISAMIKEKTWLILSLKWLKPGRNCTKRSRVKLTSWSLPMFKTSNKLGASRALSQKALGARLCHRAPIELELKERAKWKKTNRPFRAISTPKISSS